MTEKYNPEIQENKYEGWEMGDAEKSKEIIELKQEFAEILKEPGKDKSYLKKLTKLGGALALAGITVLAPPKKEAIAPENTPEYRIAQSGQDLEEAVSENKDLFIRVREALKKRGGIEISPQLETTYKTLPKTTKDIAYVEIANEREPYFSKPEIILGKEFIEKNPEKAKEYMEKIGKTMQATVMIYRGEVFIGSGTIINVEEGVAIITNNHVVENRDNLYALTKEGFSYQIHPSYTDKKRDLAIVEPYGADEMKNIVEENKIEPLKVASKESLRPGDKLAAIGHPFGFPYEVAISKFSRYIDSEEFIKKYPHIPYFKNKRLTFIDHSSDERFRKLQNYPRSGLLNDMWEDIKAQKGDNLPGMSGGPVIQLKGENVELVGISTMFRTADGNNEILNGAVASTDIQDCLKEYSEYKKLAKSIEATGGEY